MHKTSTLAKRATTLLLSSLLWALASHETTAQVASTIDSALILGGAKTTTGSQSVQVKSLASQEVLWVIGPNPFGVGTATGATTISYSGAGAVSAKIKYAGVKVAGVNGYPFVGYGKDPWGYQNGGTTASRAKFPAKLSAMSSLTLDATYELAGTLYPGDLNVAYDLWIVPNTLYKSGASGALEVMVMPYYSFQWYTECKYIKTVSVSAVVNGASKSVNFDQRACITATGPGSYVAYIIKPESAIKSGRFKFDVAPLLRDSAKLAKISTEWYLAGIQLGTEWGNTGTTPNVDYSWSLKQFTIAQTCGTSTCATATTLVSPQRATMW